MISTTWHHLIRKAALVKGFEWCKFCSLTCLANLVVCSMVTYLAPKHRCKFVQNTTYCWKISKQHRHKSGGKMTSWIVQNTNKTRKPEERGESNEKPMRCRHGKAERDIQRERSKDKSLLINNLGIQCYILSVMRLTFSQHYWLKVSKGIHW